MTTSRVGVLIAWCIRLRLLGFRLMEIRVFIDYATRIVIAVILTFSFLHSMATRGGDLALTFVLAVTLLLLELLGDCAYLYGAWLTSCDLRSVSYKVTSDGEYSFYQDRRVHTPNSRRNVTYR